MTKPRIGLVEKPRRKAKRGSRSDYADQLFRRLIKERDDWTCQMCGYQGPLVQAAHFEGRGKRSVRWDPDNACALCTGPGTNDCHGTFDRSNLAKMVWVLQRLGQERYDALVERARTPWDRDIDGVVERLKAELARLVA